MKVLKRLELPSNQCSTMVLSAHVKVFSSFMFKACLTVVSSFANSCAPQSLSLGMDKRFRGATFVLAATKAIVGGPES